MGSNPANPGVSAMTEAKSSFMAGWFDTRTRESAMSALVLFLFVAALVAIVAGLGLASNQLLLLGCINVIAGLGLGLFCGGSGVLSIGHVTFFGWGAYGAAWFSLPVTLKPTLIPGLPQAILDTQWPLAAALIPGVAVAALLGCLTGFVMVRLRDTSAVIATFGFLIISYLLQIGLRPITNGKQSIYGLPTDQLAWPLMFAALAMALVAAFAFKSSAMGRNLEALRDNEAAARSIGIRPEPPLYWSWVLSAAIVGLAGGLFGHAIGVISPDGFYLDRTFAMVVLIILGGYRSLSGCVAGGVLITFAEEVFKHVEETLLAFAGKPLLPGIKMPQVFGLTALSFSAMILLVLYLRPEGIVGYREVAAMPWFRKFFPAKTPASGKPAAYRVNDAARLAVQNLAKHYGPFKAMTNVNLEVRPGEIVGLIGPNGAGKTTMINTITGTLFATEGEIHLNGKDATRWSAAAMAQAGLGRTFQNIRLFTSLTVLENVVAAVASRQKALSRRQAESEAMAWLATLHLDHHAQDLANGLAYGDQRRLEIARALALHPDFLLADEPAAGMNHTETQALKDLLRDLAKRYNIGVLLIEHDLPMVMELSTRIAVLTKGEQIAMGTPQEIRKNPAVIEAYIGEEQDAA